MHSITSLNQFIIIHQNVAKVIFLHPLSPSCLSCFKLDLHPCLLPPCHHHLATFGPTSTSNNSCKRSLPSLLPNSIVHLPSNKFIPSFHVSTPTNTLNHTIKQGQNHNWTTQINTRAKLKIKIQNSSYTIHNWCQSTK